MQEITKLLGEITPGEWLYIKNEESISVCVADAEGDENQARVFMEVGGRSIAEAEANAKLVMLAQSAIPTVLDANSKLSAALTAALNILSVAEVSVPQEAAGAWQELNDRLTALNITVEALESSKDGAIA
jgi:hypothetical protein